MEASYKKRDFLKLLMGKTFKFPLVVRVKKR